MTDRTAWLDQVHEEALEPALPIIDPHHHLWERPGSTYLLPTLSADLDSGHKIVSTVFIECGAFYRTEGPVALRPVGETEAVERIASGATGPVNVAQGLVAFADLTLGAAVDEVLEAHRAASPRLRGIRHGVAWDVAPDFPGYRNRPPGVYVDPRFREGFARLAAHGLTFDSWQYHPQLAELGHLVRDFPETTVIVDHVGAPMLLGPYANLRDTIIGHWRDSMRLLARYDNVVVKLGGLGMTNAALGLNERALPPTSEELAHAMEPFMRHVIDTFGPARCMFESNFPVDKLSFSYGVMWNAFKRLSACYTPEERADLFSGTAARVYRLQ